MPPRWPFYKSQKKKTKHGLNSPYNVMLQHFTYSNIFISLSCLTLAYFIKKSGIVIDICNAFFNVSFSIEEESFFIGIIILIWRLGIKGVLEIYSLPMASGPNIDSANIIDLPGAKKSGTVTKSFGNDTSGSSNSGNDNSSSSSNANDNSTSSNSGNSNNDSSNSSSSNNGGLNSNSSNSSSSNSDGLNSSDPSNAFNNSLKDSSKTGDLVQDKPKINTFGTRGSHRYTSRRLANVWAKQLTSLSEEMNKLTLDKQNTTDAVLKDKLEDRINEVSEQLAMVSKEMASDINHVTDNKQDNLSKKRDLSPVSETSKKRDRS